MAELAEPERGIVPFLKSVQKKTAFLPEYGFPPDAGEAGKEDAESAWPGIDAGTSAAGIIGAGIVLGMILLIGLGIRSFRRKSS